MPIFIIHSSYLRLCHIAEYLFPSFYIVQKVAKKIFAPIITRNLYDSSLIKFIDHEAWWINVAM